MAYTATLWSELKSALLERLGSGSQTFWTDTGDYPEVDSLLRETLFYWGTLSHYWRDRVTFATANATPWHDLRTKAPAFFASSLTNRQIVAEIQHHLLEIVDPETWAGSDMFTLAQVVGALERRRDQFLVETGIQLDHEVLTVGSIPSEGRLALAADVIDVLRASWITPSDADTSIFTQMLTSSEGFGGFTLRQRLDAGQFTNIDGITKLKLRLKAGPSPLITSGAYIQQAAASGDPYDFSSTPVSVTVGGLASFTIPANDEVVTDILTVTIPTGAALVFSAQVTSGAWARTTPAVSGRQGYFKSGADAATVDATGYTAGSTYAITEIIEVVTTNTYTHLWKDDPQVRTAYTPGWQAPGTPESFSRITTQPVTLELIPPPAGVGQIDLVTVKTGAALDTSTSVPLGIPDEFAWVVKWGALSDLLGSEGQGRDVERAAYCEIRWRQGVSLAREYPSILAGRIMDVPVQVSPLHAHDAYDYNWENSAEAAPDTLYQLGRNLLVASPIPDGVYGLALDVVRPAPIPSGGQAVQVGQEVIDTLLDYAQHIAAFKQGGEEFKVTLRHAENIIRQAMAHNQRLRGMAIFEPAMDGKAHADPRLTHRRNAEDSNG
jgi:hypothetical protein